MTVLFAKSLVYETGVDLVHIYYTSMMSVGT